MDTTSIQRVSSGKVSEQEARINQEARHADLLASHKRKEWEKEREKILKKVSRYAFLDTSPGYSLTSSSAHNPSSSFKSNVDEKSKKDSNMRQAREKLQENYTARIRKEL